MTGIIHSNYSAGYETDNEYRAKKAVTGTLQFLLSNTGTLYGWLDELSNEELLTEQNIIDYNVHPLRAVAFNDPDLVEKLIFPPLTYTSEEATNRSACAADIKTYCETSFAQFITGELDVNSDDVWNAHIKQIEDMGLDKLLEIDQAAYDRYAK